MDSNNNLDNQILRIMSLEEINESFAHLTYDIRQPYAKEHTYYDEVYSNYGQQVNVEYFREDIINYHLALADNLDDYEEWNYRG